MELDPPTCRLDGCAEPALTTGKGRGFCSQKHYHTDWRIRTGRQRDLSVRTCPYPPCSVEFRPRRADQVYCCREHKGRDRYRRNPAAHKAAEERQRQKNPDYIRRRTERARQWVADNPERASAHFRRATLRQRGITPEGYDALAEAFDGTCWICRKVMAETTPKGSVRSLHVDHDHAHEVGDPLGVRGLLDTWCNTRLALVEDAPRVAELQAYLDARATYLPPAPTAADVCRGRHWQALGLTAGQYAGMVTACGGRCEICGEPEKPTRSGAARSLSVDHDHTKTKDEPGFVRGLVCNSCNSALGVLENRDWWALAVAYLTWAPPLAQRLTAPHPLAVRRRPR